MLHIGITYDCIYILGFGKGQVGIIHINPSWKTLLHLLHPAGMAANNYDAEAG